MGNSNLDCPFLKQTEIQIGICREVNYMEKNKKENTNNLISRIKARANAGKNTEEKKSPDSLILRIKRRANADKNKERER